MDPISWCIIGAVAVGTGAITYFATSYASKSNDDLVKEHINNQIILAQEKDNSHEFSQTVILSIIIIILIIACIYYSIKCAFRALNKSQSRNNRNEIEV